MKKSEIEQYCQRLVEPITNENCFFLWDVEYVKEGSDYYLRVYIDKENGVTIDDCVLVSRALEAKLDEEDKIKEAYILEVSSPGLTRPLKRENDFKNSVGRVVDIKLYKARDGRKEFSGVLKAYSSENVTISDESDNETTILRTDISSIKLAFIQ